MARSKTKSRKSTTARQARETQKSLTILRKKGLIGKTEYRGKPSGSTYRLLKKYKDVIDGNAVVVKPKSKLIPKRIKTALKERRGLLVVPKVAGTVSTTVGQRGIIKRTRKGRNGKLIREIVPPPMAEPPALKEGQVYRFTMRNWGRESSRYFSSTKTMQEFLNFYDNRIDAWADVAIVDLPDTPFVDEHAYN